MPFDPTSEGQQAAVAMAFIGQSASDIRRRLQHLEGLQMLSLQDLVKEAERMYHKRETKEYKRERGEKREAEEREDRRDNRQERSLTRILATVVGGRETSRTEQRNRQTGYLGNTGPGPRRPRNSRGPLRQPLD